VLKTSIGHMSMIKKIPLGFIIIMLMIQLIRPSKNLWGEVSKDIGATYSEPDGVKAILADRARIATLTKRYIHGTQKFSLWDDG